jgi:hypothetical protein
MAIVSDHRTLRGMEIAGFIVRDGKPSDRVRHWSGLRARVITCHAGPKLENYYDTFTYKGEEYRLTYIDGCFAPFVVKVGQPLPPYV